MPACRLQCDQKVLYSHDQSGGHQSSQSPPALPVISHHRTYRTYPLVITGFAGTPGHGRVYRWPPPPRQWHPAVIARSTGTPTVSSQTLPAPKAVIRHPGVYRALVIIFGSCHYRFGRATTVNNDLEWEAVYRNDNQTLFLMQFPLVLPTTQAPYIFHVLLRPRDVRPPL